MPRATMPQEAIPHLLPSRAVRDLEIGDEFFIPHTRLEGGRGPHTITKLGSNSIEGTIILHYGQHAIAFDAYDLVQVPRVPLKGEKAKNPSEPAAQKVKGYRLIPAEQIEKGDWVMFEKKTGMGRGPYKVKRITGGKTVDLHFGTGTRAWFRNFRRDEKVLVKPAVEKAPEPAVSEDDFVSVYAKDLHKYDLVLLPHGSRYGRGPFEIKEIDKGVNNGTRVRVYLGGETLKPRTHLFDRMAPVLRKRDSEEPKKNEVAIDASDFGYYLARELEVGDQIFIEEEVGNRRGPHTIEEIDKSSSVHLKFDIKDPQKMWARTYSSFAAVKAFRPEPVAPGTFLIPHEESGYVVVYAKDLVDGDVTLFHAGHKYGRGPHVVKSIQKGEKVNLSFVDNESQSVWNQVFDRTAPILVKNREDTHTEEPADPKEETLSSTVEEIRATVRGLAVQLDTLSNNDATLASGLNSIDRGIQKLSSQDLDGRQHILNTLSSNGTLLHSNILDLKMGLDGILASIRTSNDGETSLRDQIGAAVEVMLGRFESLERALGDDDSDVIEAVGVESKVLQAKIEDLRKTDTLLVNLLNDLGKDVAKVSDKISSAPAGDANMRNPQVENSNRQAALSAAAYMVDTADSPSKLILIADELLGWLDDVNVEPVAPSSEETTAPVLGFDEYKKMLKNDKLVQAIHDAAQRAVDAELTPADEAWWLVGLVDWQKEAIEKYITDIRPSMSRIIEVLKIALDHRVFFNTGHETELSVVIGSMDTILKYESKPTPVLPKTVGEEAKQMGIQAPLGILNELIPLTQEELAPSLTAFERWVVQNTNVEGYLRTPSGTYVGQMLHRLFKEFRDDTKGA